MFPKAGIAIPEYVIRQWRFRLLHTHVCTPEGAGNPAGVRPECSDWGADQNNTVDAPLTANSRDTGWKNINSVALTQSYSELSAHQI